MKIHAECISCQLNRQLANIQKHTDEEKKLAFMNDVCRIMAELDPRYTSPVALEEINRKYRSYFGEPYDYAEEKEGFDRLMLSLQDEIRQKIKKSNDALHLAVKYAMAGNYIDFGVYRSVSRQQLLSMLDDIEKERIDHDTLLSLKNNLSSARSLVYLTDNCGESVMDKLLIETVKDLYPAVNISIIVRGSPVLNDVTLEDAHRIGLDALAPVYSNGTGIPGTQLDKIDSRCLELLNNADLIISKGQGNFETLHGCGLNIYYLLLCKCELFMRLFHKEKTVEFL